MLRKREILTLGGGTGCSRWATDNVARRAIFCLFLCTDVVGLGFCPSSGEWTLRSEHWGWGLARGSQSSHGPRPVPAPRSAAADGGGGSCTNPAGT